MPGQSSRRKTYPTMVRILSAAGIIWLVLSAVGGLIAFYFGISISSINPILTPSVIFGLALSVIASGWRAIIDRRVEDDLRRKSSRASS